MVEGLSQHFNYWAEQNGHTLQSVVWYSSSTELWATSDTLNVFLNRVQPTFIVICLGSNELFVRDLDRREGYIRQIVSKLGDTPFVWVSPPNWKDDTGINDRIISVVGKSRYFDSRHLTLERRADHAHPTLAAAGQWMELIANWLCNPDSTAHAIRLDKATGRPTTIHTTFLSVNAPKKKTDTPVTNKPVKTHDTHPAKHTASPAVVPDTI